MPPAKNAKIAANNAERQQIVENPIDLSMADVTQKMRNCVLITN
jgi:hypothetical protein